MPEVLNALILRRDAAEATLAQYVPVPFIYGRNDCVRMTAAHLRRMGHRVSLVKGGTYRTEAQAIKALARAGYDSLEAALDERFTRIPPASAWVGDILTLPTEGTLSALAICLGNNVVLHVDPSNGSFVTSRALQYVAAWRVPYQGKAK